LLNSTRLGSMPAKRPQPHTAPHAEAKNVAPAGLRCSDTPGVFLNSFNVPCDERGVALSFQQVRDADRKALGDVSDSVVDTPAKFLAAVALDPRNPMWMRIDAAKAAAPYTDRKMPTSIDGGLGPEGAPQPLLKLEGHSLEELKLIQAALAKAGARVA
jgi:hypothetical protein